MKRELLSAGFTDTIYVDIKYHEQHPHYIHKHNNRLELLYINEGNGQYYVRDREYIVQAGNLVICNSGVMHGEVPNRNNSMQSYCCLINDLHIENLQENTLFSGDHNPVLYFQDGAVGNLIKSLHEFNNSDERDFEICTMLANALLNIVYNRIKKRENIIAYNKKNNEEFAQELMKYMDANYAEPITLEDIANEFHISQSALSRFFKNEVGISPMKYITYRRIGEAQNLLENTNLSLGEIGSRLSFYDSSHFSSVFKKNVGVTPSQYRINFLK